MKSEWPDMSPEAGIKTGTGGYATWKRAKLRAGRPQLRGQDYIKQRAGVNY